MADEPPGGGRRVLAIALDGAAPALLERWCDTGDMPHLAALRRAGLRRPIESPPGLSDDAVWMNFATGQDLAGHGRYFYLQPRVEDYALPFIEHAGPRPMPLWHDLGEAAAGVVAVDVPKTLPASGFDGVQICDWAVHGGYSRTPRSWPPDLAADVVARHVQPDHEYCRTATISGKVDDPVAVIACLEAELESKAALILDLMDQRPWTLFVAGIGVVHCAGHAFWAFHDESDPRHDPAAVAACGGDPLQRLYGAVDGVLARLCSAAPADTTIVVFTPNGMARNVSANSAVEPLLRCFESARRSAGDSLRAARRRVVYGAYDLVRKRRIPAVERMIARHRACRDRLAFTVPYNEAAAAIRINLKGREFDGRVPPGDPYRRLCDDLAAYFGDLRDERGKPAVARVLRARIDYDGPAVDHLPDLFVVWRREHQPRRLHAPDGAAADVRETALRPGNHDGAGILYARGPGLPANAQLAGMPLTEVLPALGACAGLPFGRGGLAEAGGTPSATA